MTLWLFVFLLCGVSNGDQDVFTDSLQNNWENWSWGDVTIPDSRAAHSGTRSIGLVVKNFEGVFLNNPQSISPQSYSALEFWVNGGTTGGQPFVIRIQNNANSVLEGNMNSYLQSGSSLPANTWIKVVFPLSALSGSFNQIMIQAQTGDNMGTVYFDDVVLVSPSSTSTSGTTTTSGSTTGPIGNADVTVSVNLTQNRRSINPEIYGVNHATNEMIAAVPYTVNRNGGNAATRYNWRIDSSNRGSDWFFMNIGPFVRSNLARGIQPMMTIPMTGWTANSQGKNYSYSVAKYGAQAETECTLTGGASWCIGDAGNGKRANNGAKITNNDPTDANVAIDHQFTIDWINHLKSQFGTASNGGVKYYSLDNEPMLWSETHFDVHANPTTYDELWAKTVQYAGAVKQTDPGAITFGPVLWGWCAYFWSAADNCGQSSADRTAHGGVPFLEWYTGKVCEYERQNGVRLVDYIDIHYYPQGGESLNSDERTEIAALRLRSTKSLYHPTYIDESWIGQNVRLIPRMKELIASKCPGLKLAITEYEWGGDNIITGALAQVEILGIFGREGVDLATRWVAPGRNTKTEEAFRMYLNYNGQGAKVEGDSVSATSSNVDLVGSYAIHSSTNNRLFVVLINKDTTAHVTQVNCAQALTGSVQLYRFAATTTLSSAGTSSLSGNSFTISLPSRSATLAVVSTDATSTTSGTSSTTSGTTRAATSSTTSGTTSTTSGTSSTSTSTTTSGTTSTTSSTATSTSSTTRGSGRSTTSSSTTSSASTTTTSSTSGSSTTAVGTTAQSTTGEVIATDVTTSESATQATGAVVDEDISEASKLVFSALAVLLSSLVALF